MNDFSHLRIAVVGCGRMGRERAFAAMKRGARVAVACDVDTDVASDLAGRLPECRPVASIDDIDWESTDAAFICTPPSQRAAVVTAINHEVPVFMEKPIGVSADDCGPTLRALEARPTINAVGYMNRYRESVQQARQRLEGQEILAVSSDWLVGSYAVPWWNDKALSGGPLNEQATHLIDLARYLVGEIDVVQGFAAPLPGAAELEGTAALNLRFSSGAPFSLLYSCQARTKMIHFTLYTPDRSLRLQGWDFRIADAAPQGMQAQGKADESTPANAIFQSEVDAFLRAVDEGSSGPILSDFADAMRTQRVVDAVYRALRSGRAETVGS